MKGSSKFGLDCLKHLLPAVSAGTLLGLSSPMASAIEEPKYTVVRDNEGFEIREYKPYTHRPGGRPANYGCPDLLPLQRPVRALVHATQ